ncbi:hypothetical protein CASFOL_004502 [Castilleja foliolosa]|uniref:Uncharacterized protein n=1 Tax=Castilleja foliolosa TaxID=1961234 RepID=A0ABD3EAP0_9LAMI
MGNGSNSSVNPFEDEGFRGSWYTATVLRPPPKKASRKPRIRLQLIAFGVFRPDPIPKKPKSFSPESESVKALPCVHRNNASWISSIKDLQMRRVFTPDVISVLEEEVDEEAEDMKKPLEGSDATRALDPNVGDAKLDELEKPDIMACKTEDARKDFENDLNFKDPEISGNGSDSETKTAPNRCRRKKVFKTSSSFSYNKLLPYLMSIKNDEFSETKIEIVDAVIPCKLQKLDGLKSETAEKSSCVNAKCVVPQFDDSKTEMTINEHGSNVAENKLGQTAEVIGASSIAGSLIGLKRKNCDDI